MFFHLKLHEVELLGLVSRDLPEREEAADQLGDDHEEHDNVGRPLHGQDDQVLVEQEEALEGQLEQDRQQPKARQFRDLEIVDG